MEFYKDMMKMWECVAKIMITFVPNSSSVPSKQRTKVLEREDMVRVEEDKSEGDP